MPADLGAEPCHSSPPVKIEEPDTSVTGREAFRPAYLGATRLEVERVTWLEVEASPPQRYPGRFQGLHL